MGRKNQTTSGQAIFCRHEICQILVVIPYKNTRMGSKTPGVYVICFFEAINSLLECPRSKIGQYMNLAL